jgi:hypothetical protein
LRNLFFSSPLARNLRSARSHTEAEPQAERGLASTNSLAALRGGAALGARPANEITLRSSRVEAATKREQPNLARRRQHLLKLG